MIKLEPQKAAFLLVDVQEKLFPHVDHACDMLERQLLLISGLKLLEVPMLVTEQYPKGLGPTIKPLQDVLGEKTYYPSKTTFSAAADEGIKAQINAQGRSQYIVAGIEAHVCVLQTVRDLIKLGKEVVVVNDAISSRSIYDFSSGIAEMRDMGARISSTETVLFELFHDAKHPQFKALSALIK